ncbi:MAG: hypothetical protein WAO02_08270, partial [Verrucomicrobiia bacterium]
AVAEPSPVPASKVEDDTPAQAAARAALEQKLNTLDNSQPQPPPMLVTPPPAETMPAETSTTPQPGAAAPATTTPAPAESLPATPVPAATPAPAPAPSTISQTPAPAGVPNPPSQVTAVIPGQELGLKAMEAPNVPITLAQQAQLDDLLAKYKANEITPVEYHKQRAAILAEPQK